MLGSGYSNGYTAVVEVDTKGLSLPVTIKSQLGKASVPRAWVTSRLALALRVVDLPVNNRQRFNYAHPTGHLASGDPFIEAIAPSPRATLERQYT